MFDKHITINGKKVPSHVVANAAFRGSPIYKTDEAARQKNVDAVPAEIEFIERCHEIFYKVFGPVVWLLDLIEKIGRRKMILDFGKYKGKDIQSVPRGYLVWLVYYNDENPFSDYQIPTAVALAAEEEIKRRAIKKEEIK